MDSFYESGPLNEVSSISVQFLEAPSKDKRVDGLESSHQESIGT